MKNQVYKDEFTLVDKYMVAENRVLYRFDSSDYDARVWIYVNPFTGEERPDFTSSSLVTVRAKNMTTDTRGIRINFIDDLSTGCESIRIGKCLGERSIFIGDECIFPEVNEASPDSYQKMKNAIIGLDLVIRKIFPGFGIVPQNAKEAEIPNADTIWKQIDRANKLFDECTKIDDEYRKEHGIIRQYTIKELLQMHKEREETANAGPNARGKS